jgi:signal transduction histidine kinase
MPARLPLWGGSKRALGAAFSAVTVAFLLSTAVAEYSDVEIQRAARQITEQEAPGVAELATLRGEIRRYVLLADDVADRGVDGVTQPVEPQLERVREEIQRSFRQYQVVAARRANRPLDEEVAGAQAALDAAMVHFDSQMRDGTWSTARKTLATSLRPASDHLDEVLMHLISDHAERGAELARHIAWLGRRSITVAIGLDTVSIVLAVLTAIMTVRVVRRYTDLVEGRAAELELFAGRVAHDVLGPLGAAVLALDVAAREAQKGGRVERLVASGQAGLRRARSIADALLDFARSGAQPTPGSRCDVADVVRAVIDEIEPEARTRGIALETDIESPGVAACSSGILASIVSNLARNAVKYVGDGADKRVVVSARPGGRGVRIEVADNGPGLPVGLGRQVFEPYVRGADSNKPGIGLGLATVKKITEAHGGRVDVKSTPGQGARFVVELPTSDLVPIPTPTPGPRRLNPDRSQEPSPDQARDHSPEQSKEGVDPPSHVP